MRAVRWLFVQDRLARSDLLGLLALLSRLGLDHESDAVAFVAMEMLDEGWLDEGLDLIELMLLATTARM